MNKHYVYAAYGMFGEVLYIGKGSGDRYKHCNSGASSCKELNRYYFENGDNSITVSKYTENLTHEEAVLLEQQLIKDLKPKFNVQFAQKLPLTNMEKLEQGILKDFKTVSEIYYNAHKNNNTQLMQKILTNCKEFAEIVKTIGIEEIKSTGFHKTKSKTKYKKVVALLEV